MPDWKNYSDQACSCPRDLLLSASWGRIEGLPWTLRTSQHFYDTEGFKGGFNWAPIRPRAAAPRTGKVRFFSVWLRPDCRRNFFLLVTSFFYFIYFYDDPYTLVMRCVWESIWNQTHFWQYWISVSRDYITLPYLTIWHAHTIPHLLVRNQSGERWKRVGPPSSRTCNTHLQRWLEGHSPTNPAIAPCLPRLAFTMQQSVDLQIALLLSCNYFIAFACACSFSYLDGDICWVTDI